MSQGRRGDSSLLRFLALLVLVAASSFGCAVEITGARHLVPDPLWVEAGNELKDGFLVLSGDESRVQARPLEKAEWLELLKKEPEGSRLLDPLPPNLEMVTPFLVEVVNNSKSAMVLEGQHAILRDDKGSRLFSMGFPELYQIFSDDPKGQEKIRVLMDLMFPTSPILAGDAKEGLFLFDLPHPQAEKATLRISFLRADKAIKTQDFSFFFAIEALPADKNTGQQGAGGKAH
jgi:hypothetical protein